MAGSYTIGTGNQYYVYFISFKPIGTKYLVIDHRIGAIHWHMFSCFKHHGGFQFIGGHVHGGNLFDRNIGATNPGSQMSEVFWF